jgi:uncharacterized protein
MKKVLYLHGLESKPGGSKVKYLNDRFMCYAPAMDYKNPELFGEMLDLCAVEEFDMIIGSSMGGYFAHQLATHFEDVELTLFNPAIHSRSFEPLGVTDGAFSVYGRVVLGLKDDVINPTRTYDMVASDSFYDGLSVIPVENMGHRTPLPTFIDIMERFVMD